MSKRLEKDIEELRAEIKELWRQLQILDNRTVKNVRLCNPYDLESVAKLRKR
jgi:hypothetical protein